jgi:hypothetical protein
LFSGNGGIKKTNGRQRGAPLPVVPSKCSVELLETRNVGRDAAGREEDFKRPNIKCFIGKIEKEVCNELEKLLKV